ncbi:carbohydrate-binding module family 20 domain-containing protein [Kitasatospora sp. NPDC088346]|uniref:carbohydrate-binding module family 20 domain-containing protein n=1 Tax=Kitasatospora sp. NPDC088346 TaxID=3364073 RepID=UPI00380A0822
MPVRHLLAGRRRLRLLTAPAALLAALAPTAVPTAAAAAAAGEERPPAVTVPVRVAADTEPGDTVLISGSTAELGAWDPALAVPLTTDAADRPVWHGDLRLPPGGQVQYRYLRRAATGALTREDGPDRSAFVSPGGGTALDDRWNAADGNPVAGVFHVTATTRWGQTLYVTGGTAELGAWDPARAVPLSTSATVYPAWTGFARLPPGTAVQYKYLRRDADGGVTWENGPNRTATTPPTGTLTVDDTWR